MSNLEVKTVELILAPKNEKSRAFLDTCVFEPENIEEQNLGNLYIIGEIAKTSSSSEYLINLLVNTIRKEYYASSNRSPIESLEQSLSKTNEVLADFAEQGNIEWIGNLHMVIAVLKSNTLLFSQTGLAQTFLLRDQDVINIGQDLATDPKPHPLKTFSNVASGEISAGDKIVLATSEFKNIANEIKLRKVFGEGIDEYFQEKVESVLGKNMSAAIIFLDAVKKKTATGINFVKIPTQPNLDNMGIHPAMELDLRSAQKASPAYPGDEDRVEEVINELNAKELEMPVSQKIRRIAKTVKYIVDNIKKIIILIYNILRKGVIFAYSYLKPRVIAAAQMLLEICVNLFLKVMEKLASIPVIKSLFEKIATKVHVMNYKISSATPRIIRDLSIKNKLIIAAIIVVLAAISYSYISFNGIKKQEDKTQTYAALLESARKAQKDAEIAEANELYNGKDKTIAFIRTALSVSDKLIQSGYFVSEAQKIKQNALEQMDRIEGITRLNDISELFNFAAHSNSIHTNGLVLIGKNLYSFNSENNAIYKYDTVKNTGEIMAVNSKDIGHLKISKNAGNVMVFLTDIPAVASYDPTKSDIRKLSMKFAENENEIADITVYKQNSALYAINKSDNEIYKHASIAAGFAGGEKWLKNPVDNPLINPVSLAIDGDIYVLQNSSPEPIIKFSKGARSEFKLAEPLIPIDKATKLITDIGMKNLYILDPANNRIIVISKTGSIVKQFVSDKFNNLIDIAINTNEKNIYVLNGTLLFEIAL